MKRYNSWCGYEIHLIPGEHFCSKCKGRGIIKLKKGIGPQLWRLNWKKCPECNGEGKIDWVSKVMKL